MIPGVVKSGVTARIDVTLASSLLPSINRSQLASLVGALLGVELTACGTAFTLSRIVTCLRTVTC